MWLPSAASKEQGIEARAATISWRRTVDATISGPWPTVVQPICPKQLGEAGDPQDLLILARELFATFLLGQERGYRQCAPR